MRVWNVGAGDRALPGRKGPQSQTAAAFFLAVGLVAGVAAPSVQAQTTEKILFSFNLTDGASPWPTPFRDPQGSLYDAGVFGGTSDDGVVFKLTASGVEKVLYNFKGGVNDGKFPNGVIHDATGNMYGTTVDGGPLDSGTVFKIDKTGKETILYSFVGFPTDGANPSAGLVRDAAGTLYGTTLNAGPGGCGTVFKVDSSGNEILLHSFTCGADGAYPYSALILDSAGNLYGTTAYGGNGTGTEGFGTVFMLDSEGTETVLYRFTGGTDGAYPFAALNRDGAGNLYGTTASGGAFSGCGPSQECGTVFKVDAAGNETVLHSFGGGTDGIAPTCALIADSKHNLYGTTSGGGTLQSGTVFKLDRGGNETVLYNFGTNPNDGGGPRSGLMRDAAGNLYGTTGGGGCCGGYGIVFELTFP